GGRFPPRLSLRGCSITTDRAPDKSRSACSSSADCAVRAAPRGRFPMASGYSGQERTVRGPMSEQEMSVAGLHTVSVCYLMPPRPFLGDRFAAFLQTFFPGLDWDSSERASLAELLGDAADGRHDVYVVYRDDLPRGEPPTQALVNGFGAE